MAVEIYWIESPGPGRIAVMPRPRGGDWLELEVKALRQEGVDIVASLLEEHEIEELELEREEEMCKAAGIEYLTHPIPDRLVPKSWDPAVDFVRQIEKRLKGGKAVAVHCRAGIGRSPLVAAGALLLQGMPLLVVYRNLEQARGFPVPETAEQRVWIDRFARRIR